MLRQRILSALILGPVALAAAWIGSWAFVALVLVAGILLGWEWVRMCLGRWGLGGLALSAAAALAAVAGKVAPAEGLLLIPAAALLAPLLQRQPGRSPLWLASGALYIILPVISLVWLREQGGETLFWLLLLVWATDIGAYAAGRTIGGPKLMPKVSPNKTWAGLIGGMVSAAVVGAGMALWLGIGPGPIVLSAVSALLAVVAQAGDLAESSVKRRFGVKDSSNIIPGHGGVFDRVDGLLSTAPVVSGFCLAFGGGLPLWN
ncbi:MAG TPA: phosphatidate cytidylyltransferase [Candidatus Sulfotelmatobacter sp.]|jgi:phosphatidate cytidylyltransferase|nr:phosphatidate cytidylyltransferase [Candidatus Sulfotelmatobacter sp.]